MARMHARRKGISKSRRPLVTEAPKWQGLGTKEIKDKVVELNKAGHSTAKIGTLLRDQYAVPNVKLATGKSVSDLLKEAGIQSKLPEDMENLIKKAIVLDEHLKEKTKDLHNKRALALTEAKIRRMAKYYKRTSRIPSDWTYSRAQAKLLVE